MATPRGKSILITGASSGIGRALARAYARPGAHLALGGRNRERLDEAVSQCRAAGAEASGVIMDVRERQRVREWVESVDDMRPIDLLIASAGITTGLGMGRLHEDPDAVRAIFSINVIGVLNTIDPAVARMCARGRGQIALIGSLAALRGLPSSPAYCATKAAIHVYAEALRGSLSSQGVQVSLIAPGFVATALNREIICPKPLQMSDERAANIIRRGLDRGARMIAFPKLLYYAIRGMRLLPSRWVDAALNSVHVDITETQERTPGNPHEF